MGRAKDKRKSIYEDEPPCPPVPGNRAHWNMVAGKKLSEESLNL
jgi:hypothetical protein